jgi:hypothetical protein
MLLNRIEAAEELGIAPATLDNWRSKGRGPRRRGQVGKNPGNGAAFKWQKRGNAKGIALRMKVCKTLIRRFDPDPRLQFIFNQLAVKSTICKKTTAFTVVPSFPSLFTPSRYGCREKTGNFPSPELAGSR